MENEDGSFMSKITGTSFRGFFRSLRRKLCRLRTILTSSLAVLGHLLFFRAAIEQSLLWKWWLLWPKRGVPG